VQRDSARKNRVIKNEEQDPQIRLKYQKKGKEGERNQQEKRIQPRMTTGTGLWGSTEEQRGNNTSDAEGRQAPRRNESRDTMSPKY